MDLLKRNKLKILLKESHTKKDKNEKGQKEDEEKEEENKSLLEIVSSERKDEEMTQ